MRKSGRISAFVDQLHLEAGSSWDPRYLGFFHCFNNQLFYEAHDVLEDLWLQTRDADHLFFKGLIQFAGAFVHLQKQFLHPSHPKHGRRLAPATRLFALALRNLEPFRPHHMGLDLESVSIIASDFTSSIVQSNFQLNPWSPENSPRLFLLEH